MENVRTFVSCIFDRLVEYNYSVLNADQIQLHMVAQVVLDNKP